MKPRANKGASFYNSRQIRSSIRILLKPRSKNSIYHGFSQARRCRMSEGATNPRMPQVCACRKIKGVASARVLQVRGYY